MSGNAAFTMTDSAIVSVAHVDAPEVVPSARFDEILAETYERVGAQPGLLESLAGIKERRWWPEGHLFTDAAAAAGAKPIEASGVRGDEIRRHQRPTTDGARDAEQDRHGRGS